VPTFLKKLSCTTLTFLWLNYLTLYQQSDTEWLAQSPDSKTYHKIEITNNRIRCTCEDYRNQQQILGNACCKHIYSLLFQNGFDSLRDFQSKEAA
jgi:hypothetical protein